MYFQESETIELKEVVVEDIKKEIIAFANCNGGKLYIGVRNDGAVVGLDDPDAVALQVSNMIRDSIKPDITMFLHYETIEIDNKKIVAIDIQRGTQQPYYIAKKGLRPEGVYVRQGYSSVSATDVMIRQMIKETDGDHFESMRSLNQSLTFDSTKKEFELRNVPFELQQMRTLHLIDQDGIYSNLALLLSEQCIHTIKVAVFQGINQTVFKDRKEFTGSLMQQMNDVYNFIDFRNQTRATIDKLLRIDTRDYPEIALRESLLNLLVHRDYSFRASTLISMYSDRIEFVSVGGLPAGIDLEDIMIGISICRNPNLANVFYRLQLIEAYGTGIRKIIQAYDHVEEKPLIEVTKHAFKITLPNINYKYETNAVSKSNYLSSPKSTKTESEKLDENEQKILELVKSQGVIVRNDIEKLLMVSSSSAIRILRQMVKQHILIQHGKAKGTKYTLDKQHQ